MNNDESRNLGGVAFLPLLVFLCLYIGCGLAFTLLGIPKPSASCPVTWPAGRDTGGLPAVEEGPH